jgi:hypothetical protein
MEEDLLLLYSSLIATARGIFCLSYSEGLKTRNNHSSRSHGTPRNSVWVEYGHGEGKGPT